MINRVIHSAVIRCRKDFPMLNKQMHGYPLVYLDSAATSLKPQSVIDTITRFYTEEYGTVHRAIYDLALESTEKYTSCRQHIQQFIGAESSEEIIFTKGTTEGINLLMYTLAPMLLSSGDNLIISELEHHANLVPWQMFAKKYGVELRVLKACDQGNLSLQQFEQLIDPKTKFLSMAHVCNSIGTLHPIEAFIKKAQEHQIVTLIDAAQSIAHRPIDVKQLNCDFLVFSGHKLYGPTGVGILYGKKQWLEKMPPFLFGGDMIEEVSIEQTSFNILPFKFEAGTPNIAGVIGLLQAVKYLTKIGLDKICAYEKFLMEELLKGLKEIKKVRIIGEPQQREAIVSFVVEGLHPSDAGTLLNFKGIAIRTGHHCSQPTMKRYNQQYTMRVSLGLYNNLEDIEHFIEMLKIVIHKYT